jgi:hypothetical protein
MLEASNTLSVSHRIAGGPLGRQAEASGPVGLV